MGLRAPELFTCRVTPGLPQAGGGQDECLQVEHPGVLADPRRPLQDLRGLPFVPVVGSEQAVLDEARDAAGRQFRGAAQRIQRRIACTLLQQDARHQQTARIRCPADLLDVADAEVMQHGRDSAPLAAARQERAAKTGLFAGSAVRRARRMELPWSVRTADRPAVGPALES